MSNIAERIRQARNHKGLSQQKLSEHIGTTLHTIQRYENNKTKFDAEKLVKIAEITGVCPCWLLTGKGVMVREPISADDKQELLDILEEQGLANPEKLRRYITTLDEIENNFEFIREIKQKHER